MSATTMPRENVPVALINELDRLGKQHVDGTCKGMPPRVEAFALGEIGERGWNVLREDMAFPLAVIKQSAIERNRRWMQAFLAFSGVRIAPHVKTSMSPHLFRTQLEDGAWALTVATANQAAVLKRFGVDRILIANQVVSRSNLEFLFGELEAESGAELIVIVDSQAGLDALIEAGRGRPLKRRLGLLLEVGAAGGRTGFRDMTAALALARRIHEHADLFELRGVESYESVFPALAEEEKQSRIRAMLDSMLALASAIRDAGWFSSHEVVLSSGGSEYFDIVARRLSAWSAPQGAFVLIRSGCYLAHDHLAYARAFDRLLARQDALRDIAPGLEGALEVWGVVQSRPEPETLIVTVGKRDISFDFELPAARLHFRPGRDVEPRPLTGEHRVVRLNDQHAFVHCHADADFAAGDLIAFGISHPCTTFDKWQVIPVVDDRYNVRSAIRTFF
ncbi:alanine racemase [Paraburkholderia agricolaris]|uniref:alanine racemase n=1 Tax=Paraburkholderia agricolaris TaxID=2152888 RepID=UPI0038B81D82